MNFKRDDYVIVKRSIHRITEVDGKRKAVLYVARGAHGVIVEVFENQPPTSSVHHTRKTRRWFAKVQIDGVVKTLRLTSLARHEDYA